MKTYQKRGYEVNVTDGDSHVEYWLEVKCSFRSFGQGRFRQFDGIDTCKLLGGRVHLRDKLPNGTLIEAGPGFTPDDEAQAIVAGSILAKRFAEDIEQQVMEQVEARNEPAFAY